MLLFGEILSVSKIASAYSHLYTINGPITVRSQLHPCKPLRYTTIGSVDNQIDPQ